jgi:hypothetical protein
MTLFPERGHEPIIRVYMLDVEETQNFTKAHMVKQGAIDTQLYFFFWWVTS